MGPCPVALAQSAPDELQRQVKQQNGKIGEMIRECLQINSTGKIESEQTKGLCMFEITQQIQLLLLVIGIGFQFGMQLVL